MFDDLMDDHGETGVEDYVLHDLNSGETVNAGCPKKPRKLEIPYTVYIIARFQETYQGVRVSGLKPSVELDIRIEEKTLKQPARAQDPDEQATLSEAKKKEEKTLKQPAGAQDPGEQATLSEAKKKTNVEENLITYLKSDGDGKLILKYYYDNKRFAPEIRALLTRTIIKKFKDDALKTLEVGQKLPNFVIETKVFIALSEAIESLFPGELASTYYSPFKSENGTTVQTSGTLWWHYNYTLEKLRSSNLLDRAHHSKKKEKPAVQQILSAEVNVALNSLENSLDSSTCLENWRITHQSRVASLIVDKLSITDYMNRFPCLRVQDAKQLFELDFDLLKPGKSHNLQKRWPIVKQVLIQQFEILAGDQKKKKKLSIDDLAYIKLLPTLESERQDAVVMYLLQLLIGTGHPGKRRKDDPCETSKSYQSEEIRNSFIYRVEKVEDIDEEIKGLKTKLLQRKETLQPLTLIVGSLLRIDEAYVVVDEQKYKVPSCLAALELTFKTIFALDCAYPKASFRIWQFIQYAAFDIQVAGDSLIKSVKELLGLIKQALLESATPNDKTAESTSSSK